MLITTPSGPASLIALLAVSSLTLLSTAAKAQTEIGAAYGHSYYVGDLQPDGDYGPLPIGNGHSAYGLYGRYFLTDRLAANVSATSTFIEGSDRLRENTRERNLTFSSKVYEVAAAAEYYVFGTEGAVAPYLSAGAAFYRFNPQTTFNGSLVDLQPLGTEGQGMDGYGPRYSLNRFALPVGAGARVTFGEHWVIGVEGKLRLTFFDHLDDVSGAYVNYDELIAGNGPTAAALGDRSSTGNGEPRLRPTGSPRGNPGNFDYYMTAQLTVGYRLGSGAFSGGSGASRYNKCYSF